MAWTLRLRRGEGEEHLAAGALRRSRSCVNGSWLPPSSFLASFGLEDGVLALGGVGLQGELQLGQLAVGQREAIEHLAPG